MGVNFENAGEYAAWAQRTMQANSIRRRRRGPGALESYDGDRDYDQSLGYLKTRTYHDYHTWYSRFGIANTIVSLPAEDTWQRPPAITEGGREDTPFVEAWSALSTRLRTWSALRRVDRISGIGEYGALVIGLAGGSDPSVPVEPGGVSGPDDVLYMRPVSQGGASIISWVTDASDVRYGMPEVYGIDVSDEDGAGQRNYHWTRVIHVAEGLDDSETYGAPRLELVLNYLFDLLKLSGGTAEAVWLNMRPGTLIKPGEGYQVDMSLNDLEDYYHRYAHDPLRLLTLPYAGLDVEQIGPSEVPNATPGIDSLIDLICAATRIPRRKLLGSAAGQLSAAREDTRQWAAHIASRQVTYAEPDILRRLIDRLIWCGALPEPARGYDVGAMGDDGQYRWPMIVEMDDVERAEIMERKAAARDRLRDGLGALPTTRAENRELLGLRGSDEPAANSLQINQLYQPPTTGNDRADEILAQFNEDVSELSKRAIGQGLERDEYEAELAALIAAIAVPLYLAASDKSPGDLDEEDHQRIREYQRQNLDSVPGLAADLYGGRFVDEDTGDLRDGALAQRLSLWTMDAMGLANTAAALGHPERRYRWALGATIEHCTDCLRLDGQVHTGAQWSNSGWLPQSSRLECGGWQCDCALIPTDEEVRGNF